MVRCANDHRVDLPAHVIKHLAVVAEALSFGMFLEGFGGTVLIHVAEGGDVLPRHLAKVFESLASASDNGQIQFGIGGALNREGAKPIQSESSGPHRSHAGQHLTAIQSLRHRTHSYREEVILTMQSGALLQSCPLNVSSQQARRKDFRR
jgi:hypothetical protein